MPHSGILECFSKKCEAVFRKEARQNNECFRQKCEAVFRKEARQNKGLVSACDLIKTGQTLVAKFDLERRAAMQRGTKRITSRTRIQSAGQTTNLIVTGA
jgi:hypothetical protein